MPTGIMEMINTASFVTINCRKVVASSLSRSQQYATENQNAQVYTFRIGTHSGMKYSENRDLIADLYDRQGTTNEELIALTGNAGSQYITAYLGDLTQFQRDSLLIKDAGTGNTNIIVNTQNVTGSPIGYLYKAGDFMSPRGPDDNYRYTYQVTADVPWSVGNVTVPVNRPVIAQSGVTLTGGSAPVYSGGIKSGNDARWTVKITKMPQYSITPHDLIEWDSDLELIEVIL